MAKPELVKRWSDVLDRLRQGPAPRGDQFELCREVLAAAPQSPEAMQAARLLLEGAMADDHTSIADAQEVMGILKAAGTGELDIAELLAAR